MNNPTPPAPGNFDPNTGQPVNHTPNPNSNAPIANTENRKLIAGLCGIFLGSLGIHKFLLGYNTEGIIMVAVSLLTCGIGAMVMSVVGIIEGIMYLVKTDAEFDQMYIHNKKAWF